MNSLELDVDVDEKTLNSICKDVEIIKSQIGPSLYEYIFKGPRTTYAINKVYTHAYSLAKHKKFYENISKLPLDLQKCVEDSLSIIKEAFDRFGQDNIAFSFNGGKDCTVLLHLIRFLSDPNKKIKTIYILPEHSFDMVEEFCEKASIVMNLKLERYAYPMQEGLRQFMQANEEIKAVFLGVRRTDPYAQDMLVFQETSAGWPKLMRVNPILDWSYSQVWTFLRAMDIEYCELYDLGYTSIGSLDDTLPNPLLKTDTGYKPASELRQEAAERAGRKSKK